MLSTTTSPTPDAMARATSSSSLALPWSTREAGSAPAARAVMISPPPATSRPRPSSTMTRWTAVHGNDFDANTTRERGHRAARPSRYARARARRASSATTRVGVPNSAATSSNRTPPTVRVPSASRAAVGGNRSIRWSLTCSGWRSRALEEETGGVVPRAGGDQRDLLGTAAVRHGRSLARLQGRAAWVEPAARRDPRRVGRLARKTIASTCSTSGTTDSRAFV